MEKTIGWIRGWIFEGSSEKIEARELLEDWLVWTTFILLVWYYFISVDPKKHSSLLNYSIHFLMVTYQPIPITYRFTLKSLVLIPLHGFPSLKSALQVLVVSGKP